VFRALSFSPSGDLLASGVSDEERQHSEVTLLKLPGLEEVAKLHVPGVFGGRGISFSSDGKTIATSTWRATGGTGTGELRFWDVSTHKQLAQLTLPGVWHTTVVFKPDGKTLVASDNNNATLFAIEKR
jgi:WD40 repeat protein